MRSERLQLGGENEIAPTPSIEQRLFTETIAAQRKLLLGLIPDGESEHPDETRQRFCDAPLSNRVEKSLGVRMSAPVGRATASFQFAPYIEMIVDFAVERNRESPAVAAHRLRAGFG